MSPRIKAFLIHLAISLAILVVLLLIIYKIWYPQPFFSGDGGWQGMRLVASVDIILGPLLTLIIYNIKKPWKELQRDLTIIALIQFSALSWGTWQVYEQRTQMIVFTEHYFTSLSEDQIRVADILPQILKKIKAQEPPIAFVWLPDDIANKKDMLNRNSVINNLHNMGELYELPNTENQKRLLERGLDLQRVAQAFANEEIYANGKSSINDFLKHHDSAQHRYVLIPIRMRYKNLSLVFDKNNGEIVGTLPVTLIDLISVLMNKPDEN